MDLFQRTCVKEGVIFGDDEANREELSEESIFESYFDEEECDFGESDEAEYDDIYKELECMKRRIQKLQLRLKQKKLEKCPEEVCMDYEVLLNCSSNPEIADLQKKQHKLQCQILELNRCCSYGKDQIADLRSLMCQKHKEILELQKMVALLESWRLTLDHEFGLCLERFEYLKTVKADAKNVTDLIENVFQKCKSSFVPYAIYAENSVKFRNYLTIAQIRFNALLAFTNTKFKSINKFLKDSQTSTRKKACQTPASTTELSSKSSKIKNVK